MNSSEPNKYFCNNSKHVEAFNTLRMALRELEEVALDAVRLMDNMAIPDNAEAIRDDLLFYAKRARAALSTTESE